MKKWMQHLTGVIMGSVLALTLNGKACAEEPESASPDLPEPEIADGASVNSAAPAGEAPDAAPAEDSAAGEAEIAENEETIDEEETVEEENAVGTAVEDAAEGESEADAADSLPASEIPEEADDSPALLTKSAKAAATESASAELITVGDVSFDGTEDVFTGMSEDEDRNGIHHGWYWTADNQSLSLVYYAGADETISVKNGNLRIQAAGLNQVASIICDGVVDLIGTGILLVDDIDLGETGVFNILPNADIYGEDGGCVAVFRKQDDGSYLLINGSVPGILDEVYTLPEGVDLVVPEGSTLLMNSLVAVPDSDGGYTYYSGDEATGLTVSGWAPEVSGQLIISENSSLTVEKGATLAVCATPSANESGQTLMPCLDVAGSLELNEPITGGGLIRQREGGTVTGVGALSATELVLQDQDQLEAGLVAIGKTAGDSLGYAELVELA
jgi:hypothetical protein